jgi:hypothetical protein
MQTRFACRKPREEAKASMRDNQSMYEAVISIDMGGEFKMMYLPLMYSLMGNLLLL